MYWLSVTNNKYRSNFMHYYLALVPYLGLCCFGFTFCLLRNLFNHLMRHASTATRSTQLSSITRLSRFTKGRGPSPQRSMTLESDLLGDFPSDFPLFFVLHLGLLNDLHVTSEIIIVHGWYHFNYHLTDN